MGKVYGLKSLNYLRYYTLPFVVFCLLVSLPYPTLSDTLISRTKTYRDVVVIEGENLFYILNSVDGSIESIAKENIIEFTPDTADRRIELRNEWKQKRLAKTNMFSTHPIQSNHSNGLPPKEEIVEISTPSSEGKTSDKSQRYLGYLDNNLNQEVKNSNLPSTNATVKTLPGSQGIIVAHNSPQYSGYGGYLYSRGDVMPKVVLRYPPASGIAGNYATPAVMGFGIPGMGMAPTYGGRPFYPQGGYFAGGYRDVTVISNISDMFSTIDDRLVGEKPYSFYYIKPSSSTSYINQNSR